MNIDNNPAESLTLDATIEYLTYLAVEAASARNPNGQVLRDLHVLKEIRMGYAWNVD